MRTYLVIKKINQIEHKAKLQSIWGIVLIALFGYGIYGGITDQGEGLRDGIPVYVILIAVGALLLYLGYLNYGKVGLARRYDMIMSNDKNGIVTLNEISLQIAKNDAVILKELEKLFREGFFTNCTLQSTGSPCIIINDAMVGETNIGFTAMICPSCGAATRIRAGSRGQCEICGAPIADGV